MTPDAITFEARLVASRAGPRFGVGLVLSVGLHVVFAIVLLTQHGRPAVPAQQTVHVTLRQWADAPQATPRAPPDTRPSSPKPVASTPSPDQIASARPGGAVQSSTPRAGSTHAGAPAAGAQGILGALNRLGSVGSGAAAGVGQGGARRDWVEGPIADATALGGDRLSGRRGGGEGGSRRAATVGELGTGGAGGKLAIGGGGEPSAAAVRGEGASIDSADVSQAELSQFVRARMGGIRACYETQLKRTHDVEGKLRISFSILQTGAVSDVSETEDSTGAPELVRCVVALVRGWRTPFRPAAAVSVEYPFVFSRKTE